MTTTFASLATIPTIAAVTAIPAATTLATEVTPRPEAPAATTATTAPPTVPAAMSTTSATETTGRPRGARLSLVHHERATFEVEAVKGGDGGLTTFPRSHGHEAETTAPTGLAIGSDEHFEDLTVLSKQVAKSGIGGAVVQVANVDLEHERTFPALESAR